MLASVASAEDDEALVHLKTRLLICPCSYWHGRQSHWLQTADGAVIMTEYDELLVELVTAL